MRKFLLNTWRTLTFRWIKSTGEGTFALQVMEINPKSKHLTDGLGITDERADEIRDILKKHYNTSKNICETMEKTSKELKHANELYFASFLLAKQHGNNSGGGIGSLLEMMFKSSGNRDRD